VPEQRVQSTGVKMTSQASPSLERLVMTLLFVGADQNEARLCALRNEDG
jgi:hypothetical protein